MKRSVSSTIDIKENDESSRSSTSSSKRWGGAAIYKTKFQDSWKKKWPFIQPVKTNIHQFYCTTCSKNVSCHQGEADIIRHSSSEQHSLSAKALRANTVSLLEQSRITNIYTMFVNPPTDTIYTKWIRNMKWIVHDIRLVMSQAVSLCSFPLA
uniref:Uncharacterized protein n=1 Tax=Amphimedon queenslandica TaxID=400682 RepID=A0A1X7TXY9_AMPQE